MKLEVLGQPTSAQTGVTLQGLLSDARFTQATLVSAFVKRAGVTRLEPAITGFRSRGGKVVSIAGIDYGGTTREGLQALFDVSDETYVVHSTNQFVTFHPKLALLTGTSHSAAVIGSSNFTAGGLFSNIEASVYLERQTPSDDSIFDQLQKLCDEYKAYPQCSLALTAANLATILSSLPLEVFSAGAGPNGGLPKTPAGQQGSSGLFGPGTFKAPPKAPGGQTSTKSGPKSPPTPTPPAGPTIAPAAPGFWKSMSAGDVSLKSSPGQIIIPIEMIPMFPPLGPDKLMPAGGTQADVFFDVVFRDGAFSRAVKGARLVKYVPSPKQRRKNTEHRFTFKDRSVFPSRFSEGDIMLFRSTGVTTPFFEIERVAPGTPLFAQLRASSTGDFGTI